VNREQAYWTGAWYAKRVARDRARDALRDLGDLFERLSRGQIASAENSAYFMRSAAEEAATALEAAAELDRGHRECVRRRERRRIRIEKQSRERHARWSSRAS
jgi:hypothetical protein